MNPQPFGYYTLINRVNVGGMAEVFKACYYQEDGRPAFAAIKRILPHLAQDPSFVEMFLSEATTSSRLKHPSIAQIIEQGEEEGEYFISMEYISGRDLLYLRHHLKERGALMSPALCAHVIASIADALDYAHSLCDESGRPLEIIHRDISPQNILVSYEGEVKLIDFGIAKAKDRTYEATRAGVLKGKFSYMAPEQVRGLQADHRIDIFALGVVLYELLTNQRLFFGESDLETIELVRNARVNPPSISNDCISPELDQITLRALAADPNQRYQRAGELARDLRAFIQRNAPATSQATLKAWMYQEFSTYIAHEQAQEAHIIEQLTAQDDDEGEEYTTETSAELLEALLKQSDLPASAHHTEEITAPPGAQAPPSHHHAANPQPFNLQAKSAQPTYQPFQTQALTALAVAPYQDNDVPTRPVSAEIFKDLQNRGYSSPSQEVLEQVSPLEVGVQTEPQHLDHEALEELLDGSFDDLDESEEGFIEAMPTPVEELPEGEATEEVSQADLDRLDQMMAAQAAPSPQAPTPQALRTMPLFSEATPSPYESPAPQPPPNLYSPRYNDQTEDNKAPQAPSPSASAAYSPAHSPAHSPAYSPQPLTAQGLTAQAPAQTAPQRSPFEEPDPLSERSLEARRTEEQARAYEPTNPELEPERGEGRAPFEGLRLPTKRPSSKRRVTLIGGGAAALALLVALASLLPGLLSSSALVTLRVRPEGDLKVTLEGSAVSKGPLTKSPLRLTIDAPTKVLIERRGYEPYSLTLNPEDQQVKRQRPINVELTPFFYPTELTVLALPGCKVWLNGERLQEVTPIRGLEVQPSETGELHVKVVHPRSGAQEQRQQVKRGEVRPRHAFMFDF